MGSLVDTINISYLKEQIISGVPDDALFQIEYFHRDANEEDSDGGYEMSGFRHTCEKSWVHKLLCSAPDPNSIPEIRQIASMVILQSSLVTGSLEEHHRTIFGQSTIQTANPLQSSWTLLSFHRVLLRCMLSSFLIVLHFVSQSIQLGQT